MQKARETASRSKRGFGIGLTISVLLALAAYATNGASGWLPGPRDSHLPLSFAASGVWVVCCACLIYRFRWRGALSLLGAPLALALPVAWLTLRDSLWWGCSFHGVCP